MIRRVLWCPALCGSKPISTVSPFQRVMRLQYRKTRRLPRKIVSLQCNFLLDLENAARDRGKQVFSTYYLPPRFGVSTKKPLYPKGLSALSRLFRTSRLGSVVCCLAIRKACCSTVSATCIESLSFCRSSAISFTLLVCSLFIVLRISSTKLR